MLPVDRPTRDNVLMRQAQIVSERSTCARAHVGVVIAHKSRVVSQGYNGAPAGMPHCDHACNCEQSYLDEDHQPILHSPTCPAKPGCLISVHAEANAIAFAAKYGVATNGAHLYTTMAPCLTCSQLIINAGIVKVVYSSTYRCDDGLILLMGAGIEISQGRVVFS